MIAGDRPAVIVASNLEASGFDALLDDVVAWLAVGSKLAEPEQLRIAVMLLDVVGDGRWYRETTLLAALAVRFRLELGASAVLPPG